jgi:uncharacterized protein YoxC
MTVSALIVSIAGLVLTLVAMIVTAIWVASRITTRVETTTAVLTEQIRNLSATNEHLRIAVDQLAQKHDGRDETIRELEHRLTVVEIFSGLTNGVTLENREDSREG